MSYIVVQTYVSPKALIHELDVVSSGSQLLLSNILLLFRFKSKKQFILEICKVGHFSSEK